MPDLDPPAPDVIEFSPASPGPPAKPVRNRLLVAGAAAAAVIALAVVVTFAVTKPDAAAPAGAAAAARVSPALARLIAQVTEVPVGTSDAAGDGGGQVTAKPAPVTGRPLTAGGRPEIFYVGTQFCPYCATQSWAMIDALSRSCALAG